MCLYWLSTQQVLSRMGCFIGVISRFFLFFFLFTCVDTTTSRHEQQTFSITRRYYRKFRNFTIKVLLITVIDLFASLAPVCSPFFHFFFFRKASPKPKNHKKHMSGDFARTLQVLLTQILISCAIHILKQRNKTADSPLNFLYSRLVWSKQLLGYFDYSNSGLKKCPLCNGKLKIEFDLLSQINQCKFNTFQFELHSVRRALTDWGSGPG